MTCSIRAVEPGRLLYSLTDSLRKHLFETLFCSRNYSRYWKYSCGGREKSPKSLNKVYILVEEGTLSGRAVAELISSESLKGVLSSPQRRIIRKRSWKKKTMARIFLWQRRWLLEGVTVYLWVLRAQVCYLGIPGFNSAWRKWALILHKRNSSCHRLSNYTNDIIPLTLSASLLSQAIQHMARCQISSLPSYSWQTS